MRLMVTYETDGDVRITDVTLDDGSVINAYTIDKHLPDSEEGNDILSVVEVMHGIDYDKEGYESSRSPFPIMVLK